MGKKWLSIILMIFIILFVGCESKSNYLKKGINKQDDLLGMEELALEIEQVIFSGIAEKAKNVQENLPDEREVDTRDYSAYLKKMWCADEWPETDDFTWPISLVITHIEDGEVGGYFVRSGWIYNYYFDQCLNNMTEFYGKIYEGTAECEYIDREGESGKFAFTMFDNNEMEIMLEEGQSYLLIPYNVSEYKYCTEPVVAEVEMDSWGKVNLFYAVSDDDFHPIPMVCLTNEQGDILYEFYASYRSGSEVREVIIEDMNGDGLKDVKVVTDFGDPEGYRFEWYFYQGENGLFSLEGKEFYDQEEQAWISIEY